jgi:hypothetical protein
MVIIAAVAVAVSVAVAIAAVAVSIVQILRIVSSPVLQQWRIDAASTHPAISASTTSTGANATAAAATKVALQ